MERTHSRLKIHNSIPQCTQRCPRHNPSSLTKPIPISPSIYKMVSPARGLPAVRHKAKLVRVSSCDLRASVLLTFPHKLQKASEPFPTGLRHVTASWDWGARCRACRGQGLGSRGPRAQSLEAAPPRTKSWLPAGPRRRRQCPARPSRSSQRSSPGSAAAARGSWASPGSFLNE